MGVRRAGTAAILYVLCLVGLFAAEPAWAQRGYGPGRINEVRIEGTQRVEPETVRSYLTVQPGDQFDDDQIDRSLKALFATGLFADVALRQEGSALIVAVVENPIVNRLAFEGNSKLDDAALQAELQLRPRVVYTRTRVQNDVRRILELYRRNGRFAATVEPKVIPLPQNRIDLVFEIDEGSVTSVRSIDFVGNKRFSDGRLNEIVTTRESRWYRFFSSADSYDPDRINADRELLRRFYLAEGYADIRIVSAIAELAPARDGFYITFTVDEGERYKFGEVSIQSQIKDLKAEELRAQVPFKAGDWYNAELIERVVNRMTDALANRGYAFAEVRPRPERNREDRVVSLGFDISEGPRVYVDRIDIQGNVRTLDRVVRREMRLVEGDAFNASRLQRSQQRIRNLGFFRRVDVNRQQVADDRAAVVVEVEEQSTGELSLGAGFSTSEGPLGDIAIRERNLLGRGQDLRLAFTLSARSQQVDLSFTEPYFLERNVAAGFDVFQIQRDNQTRSSYDQFSVGGALRLGFQLSDTLRQTLRYTVRRDEIRNIRFGASRFIAEQQGERNTSAVGQTLSYDTRDNRLDPRSGYTLTLGTDFAGLGGDVRYFRGKLGGSYFYPVAEAWTLSVTGETGYIVGIGDDVGIQDRFFIGGDTLRGFRTGGIGPRDALTGDALGGNQYYIGSVSLAFPLGLPEELGVSGRVFSDFGSLFTLDRGPTTSTATLQDVSSLRASGGAGISWRSPLGPIRLDLGIPILKETFDRTEVFRVSFGTRF